MNELIYSSLEKSTFKAYGKALESYSNFAKKTLHIRPVLPIQINHVGLYITHLYESGLQYNTIQGHVSALSFYHKLYNHNDPSQSFYVSKLMCSINKKLPSVDPRKAITKPVLQRIVSALPKCAQAIYQETLFGSMFTLAYYVCLRVGELTWSNKGENIIRIEQLSQVMENGSVKAFLLKFERYKHSKEKTLVRINMQIGELCPVKYLLKYLNIRGNNKGPLYVHSGGKTVTRAQFSAMLNKCLETAGYNTTCFGTHSFRIGRCTDLARAGSTETQIKLAGRFKSNAFLRYLRPDVIHV